MQFIVTHLPIPEIMLLTPRRFEDSRGYFMVTYVASEFRRLGMPDFVQDNVAHSARRGTVRGLHFQKPPHAQAKLVRVLRGSIFDVAVDLRAGSATYGRWVGATLSARSAEQIFVPQGFAHGYCSLEDDTEVAYKCDAYYTPEADAGVRFSDPTVGVEWPVATDAAIISDKDRGLPLLKDMAAPFPRQNGGQDGR